MKSTLTVFVSLLILTLSLFAETPVTISDRFGFEIDLFERDYFNLLPGIKNFSSAILLKTNESLFFKIITDSAGKKNERMMNTDSASIQSLRIAVDNFEYLSLRKTKGINWELIIMKLITPSNRIKFETVEAEIITTENEKVFGSLLYVDSVFVVVSEAMEPMSINEAVANCRILHYSKIESISKPTGMKVKGYHSLYALNYKDLIEDAWLLSLYEGKGSYAPPEIREMLEKSKAEYLGYSNPDEKTIEQLQKELTSNFHLGLEFSPESYLSSIGNIYTYLITNVWVHVSNGFGYYKTERTRLQNIPFAGLNKIVPMISFRLNLTNRFQLLFGYNLYSENQPEWRFSVVSSKGYSLLLSAVFTISKSNLYSNSFIDQFDLNLYGGLIYGLLNSQIYFFRDPQTGDYLKPPLISHDLYGANLGMSAEYYIFRNLTFNAGLYMNILKSYIYKMDRPFRYDLLFGLDGDRINYSGVGLKFGLGLHL
jgi:hypothetical protein